MTTFGMISNEPEKETFESLKATLHLYKGIINELEAERDRWKKRCEAAERYLNSIHGRDIVASPEDYELWQSLKSK